MKRSRLLSFSAFTMVLICLSCRPDYKENFGFLGDIEVGKYQITQYREYPNGFKDTLFYEAYGPYTQAGASRYVFEIYRNSYYASSLEILENGVWYSSSDISTLDARNYASQVENLTNSAFDLNYVYTPNYSGEIMDSAIGVFSFKRLPQ